MAVFRYQAKRSIVDDHTEGFDYDLQLGVRRYDPTPDVKKTELVSLSGVRQTTLHRVDMLYRFETELIDETNVKNVEEFIHSTMAGEQFSFDMKGVPGAPDSPVNYTMVRGFTKNREGNGEVFRFAFSAVQS